MAAALRGPSSALSTRAPQSAPPTELVFAYGSLLAHAGAHAAGPSAEGAGAAELLGYRREWGVAMDNAREIRDYKAYLDPQTGRRPAVFVAFLDLRPDASGAVSGLLLLATAEQLEGLDRRERNYRRVEVTGAIRPESSRRVWTYVGTPEARERLATGLATGRAVIARDYLEGVQAGFRALGEEQWRRYAATTADPPCPVHDLRRVDLPA